MDLSSSYAKILGETNFHEVGQKQKTEKREKKEKEVGQKPEPPAVLGVFVTDFLMPQQHLI